MLLGGVALGAGGCRFYAGANVPDLIDVREREHGFMSTSLGGESTFTGEPYHFRISVPEGQPALWIGRTSRYPHQRELLLPSNILYVIKM
jgi:hypothetical protein